MGQREEKREGGLKGGLRGDYKHNLYFLHLLNKLQTEQV